MNLEKRKNSFQKIEQLVNSRGITFYRLAKDLGLAPTVFTDWKTGKSMPKTDKLLRIADYLGVTVNYFLE